MYKYITSNKKGWHTLEVEPPDKTVEIEDKNGNRAIAIPTYYPFTFDKNTCVLLCEPYWDGGWMIQCDGLESNIDSDVVRWRAID